MAVIASAAHGIIDYLAGTALVLAPWVFGTEPGIAAVVLPVVGVATIALSLITDYKFSVAKLVPFRLHLALDIALGLAMLAAGWLVADNGVGRLLLIGAGIIYLVVPALSWPRRS